MTTAMNSTRATSAYDLSANLERDGLERRLRRVTAVVAALQQRASEHRAELGATPRELGQAIADFEAQITAMNARLRDLMPLDRRRPR